MTLLAAKFRVKYKGVFDIKGLYEYLHYWTIDEGWTSGIDPEFNEVFHGQREFPDKVREIWIWWRLNKNPNNNNYYRYELDVDWHVVPPYKKVEVVHKGRKLSLILCDLEIQIHARLVSDCNDTWKKHWFLKHFNDFYWKVIMKSNFEKHKLELYREAYRFQETIKEYWKLTRGLEEPEHEDEFWPSGVVGE